MKNNKIIEITVNRILRQAIITFCSFIKTTMSTKNRTQQEEIQKSTKTNMQTFYWVFKSLLVKDASQFTKLCQIQHHI